MSNSGKLAGPAKNSEEFSQAVRAANHITIEFGTAEHPLFLTAQSLSFDALKLYIGVNIDQRQHKALRRVVGTVSGHAILGHLAGNGLQPLPLPDATVDTVFMANVFGEPDSRNAMHRFKDDTGTYHGHSSLAAKCSTLAEAKRLLKPTGELIVLETITPSWADHSGPTPMDSMAHMLSEQGFEPTRTLSLSDPEWDETVTQYAQTETHWPYASYLVAAAKTAA